jgi:methanogenic corrinoid protein MtbC1
VGAALAATAAAIDGWTIIYLGADVPARDVAAAAAASSARAVALSVVHSDDPDAVLRELQAVRQSMDLHVPLFVGGATAKRLAGRLTECGITVCDNIDAMRRVLQGAAVTP